MKPQALSPVDTREAIDRLLEHPAALVLTSHVRRRMRERRFTTDDVLRVLRHGTISRVANWDDQLNIWKYKGELSRPRRRPAEHRRGYR
jgi:hypothetical protein